jgi:hypothetical protein
LSEEKVVLYLQDLLIVTSARNSDHQQTEITDGRTEQVKADEVFSEMQRDNGMLGARHICVYGLYNKTRVL